MIKASMNQKRYLTKRFLPDDLKKPATRTRHGRFLICDLPAGTPAFFEIYLFI